MTACGTAETALEPRGLVGLPLELGVWLTAGALVKALRRTLRRALRTLLETARTADPLGNRRKARMRWHLGHSCSVGRGRITMAAVTVGSMSPVGALDGVLGAVHGLGPVDQLGGVQRLITGHTAIAWDHGGLATRAVNHGRQL